MNCQTASQTDINYNLYKQHLNVSRCFSLTDSFNVLQINLRRFFVGVFFLGGGGK